jgi:hypothetical protein
MSLFRQRPQLSLPRTNRSKARLKRKRIARTSALGSYAYVEQLETRMLLTASSSLVNMAGPFSGDLNVSNASVYIGAMHATFQQWVLFTHATVNFSASNQTSNLSMTPENLSNLPASGTTDMNFDNVTPGTFQSLNALNMNLSGPSAIPFTINASPVTVNASGLNLTVQFTINGQLSDLRFDSTGPSTAGSPFLIPGNFSAVLSANVNAALVLPLGLGTLNLGTLSSIGPTTESFSAEDLGGVTLTDQGGLSFPHDMGVNFALNLGGVTISLPLNTTLDTSKDYPGPGSGQSGLTHFDLQNTNLTGTLNLSNLQYSFNGVDPGALIAPSPPVVDLNGAAPGTGYTNVWSAASGPVHVTDPANATISDPNGAAITSMTFALASPQAGDVLAANTSGVNISASFDGATLTLSGSDTAADYQRVLRSVTYTNTAGGPGVSSETVKVVATDSNMLSSAEADATINAGFSGSIVNRLLFYNGSTRFDGAGGVREPLPFSDDNAVAMDKSAYLPGSGATTFANVSSYTLGINGLMVDLSGTHGTITANDFVFKTGNNNSPSAWTTLAAAPTVTTRTGAGSAGADRIEITFPNNAIQNTWLEVIVKGNDALGGNDTNTGLGTSAVFFWGSAVGDDGTTPDDASAFKTDANDELDARNNPKTLIANIPITNLQDYNRDGIVSVTDQLTSRNNPTTNFTAPKILNISGAGPFAPDAAPAALPMALASPAGSPAPAASATAVTAAPGSIAGLAPAVGLLSGLPSNLPPSLGGRLQNILDSPPVVASLHGLAQRDTPVSRQILQAIDQFADKYNLHDDVLDGILVDLGLE